MTMENSGLKWLKKPNMYSPFTRKHIQMMTYCGESRDREITTSDHQGAVSGASVSPDSYQPDLKVLIQFSQYVQKGGLKPHPFLFLFIINSSRPLFISLFFLYCVRGWRKAEAWSRH